MLSIHYENKNVSFFLTILLSKNYLVFFLAFDYKHLNPILRDKWTHISICQDRIQRENKISTEVYI